MSNISNKNGRIELLRFLFALMILFFHICKRFTPGIMFFEHGCIGVEFFFLVSGYLLAASTITKRDLPCDNLGTESVQMIWKKICKIFPYHLFATGMTIVVNAYFLRDTAFGRYTYAVDSLASLFFIQIFGFDSTWANKLTWYLDVWLVVTFIFYFFLRKYFDIFVKWACPLLALFILGYLDYQYVGLSGIDTWTGHFYKIFLRGMAEMAMGCTAYLLADELGKLKFSERGKGTLAVIEFAGYAGVFIYGFRPYNPKYEFMVLFVMWLLLIITFSNVNPCHRIFDMPIFVWCGKMSLLVYLNQFYAIRLVQELLPDISFAAKVVACALITFLGAFICDMVARKMNLKGLKKWFLVR